VTFLSAYRAGYFVLRHEARAALPGEFDDLASDALAGDKFNSQEPIQREPRLRMPFLESRYDNFDRKNN